MLEKLENYVHDVHAQKKGEYCDMDVIFRDAKTFHWISGRLGRGSGKGFRSPEYHEHIPICLYGACMSCMPVVCIPYVYEAVPTPRSWHCY